MNILLQNAEILQGIKTNSYRKSSSYKCFFSLKIGILQISYRQSNERTSTFSFQMQASCKESSDLWLQSQVASRVPGGESSGEERSKMRDTEKDEWKETQPNEEHQIQMQRLVLLRKMRDANLGQYTKL